MALDRERGKGAKTSDASADGPGWPFAVTSVLLHPAAGQDLETSSTSGKRQAQERYI